MWEVATGKEWSSFEDYGGNATCVAFSPDGKTLATSLSTALAFWEVATGKRELRLLENINTLAYAPDGKTLAWGGGGMVFVRDLAMNKNIRLWEGSSPGEMCLAYSPDGKTLATGGFDATIKLLDLAANKEISRFQGHRHGVRAVAYSPDGKLLASCAGTTIILWDVGNAKELRRIELDHYVSSIAFSPDSKTLAVSTGGAILWLYDVATARKSSEFDTELRSVNHLVFAPDGMTLALTAGGGTVRLRDVATGKQLQELGPTPRPRRGSEPWTRCVALSPDGKTVAAGYSWSSTALRDGDRKSICLWDAATGKELRQLDGGKSGVVALAYSPDGKLLASVDDAFDPKIRLWDAASGEERRQLQAARTPESIRYRVGFLAFSPDGKLLASSGDDQRGICSWDVSTGNTVYQLKDYVRNPVFAFSPDGKTLASNAGTTVLVWDLRKLLKR